MYWYIIYTKRTLCPLNSFLTLLHKFILNITNTFTHYIFHTYTYTYITRTLCPLNSFLPLLHEFAVPAPEIVQFLVANFRNSWDATQFSVLLDTPSTNNNVKYVCRVALLRKETYNSRHPMGLCHSVAMMPCYVEWLFVCL